MKKKQHDAKGFHGAAHSPRVAARLEGAVKNAGIKPKKKPKREK